MAELTTLRKRVRRAIGEPRKSVQWGALVTFGILMITAPLAFGAVDRLIQLALIFLFVLGLLIQPATLPLLRKRETVLLSAFLLVLVAKEFAPAQWFGSTPWRTIAEESYAIELPPTHHPEPGRAVDGLLAASLATLWFLWVRTIAAQRENRIAIAWILFAAAGIVAVVSFATRGLDAKAIYGMRFTPGWFGFGPFPNRNHTASFLAMGALMGCGCLTWLARKRQWGGLVLGAGVLVVTLAALLETESRGGLLAFAAGAVVYVAVILGKFRNRGAIVATVACGLAAMVLLLMFGSPLLARFSSTAGEVSTASRVLIWKDTLALWRDAPLLGHGVGAFVSVFPLRQTIALDNQVVLHPESSWLLWLSELGVVPLALALVLVALLAWPYLRNLFERRTSFFLLAAALSVGAVLAVHSLIDVPAHRWGTAAFALAALALFCPAREISGSRAGTRKLVALPLAVLAFWVWPFLSDRPAWSPTTLSRTLASAQARGSSEAELQRVIRYFPLNAKLHYLIGVQQLRTHGRLAPEWSQHFQAAVRLAPGSWATPMGIAQICRRLAPGYALHYWQIALERSGFRRDELFARALSETSGLSGADATWASYAESHPELLLLYAKAIVPEQGRTAFDRWWRYRAEKSDLQRGEIELFYDLAGRWASLEQIENWTVRHSELRSTDYRRWAELLHLRGEDQRAWDLLEPAIPEPAYPTREPSLPRSRLEAIWRLSPENVVNAQALAHARMLDQDAPGALQVVRTVAERENAPVWFREKAAHLLAESGRVSEAVELLLRDN